jgi:iron complex outermembrane recepter protein
MEKPTVKNVQSQVRYLRIALIAGIGLPLLFVGNAFAQNPPPEPAAAQPAAAEATAERVIVTGSNIPTAEETGPNPVDTYRVEDIAKLGVRNTTDLQTLIPQQAGGTINTNIGNGGDGTVQLNLRGLLPKETLVLIDGKRVAAGSLTGAGFSGGVDINLIPFPMIDHLDILKDGASAIYGSDAISGVANFFLVHKFRGLEIGGTYGNTNAGASNEMGEWEAWIKAGTGDDKTDIVVIADFWERLNGIFSRDRNQSANAFQIPFGGLDNRSGNFPGRVASRRLLPTLFFSANTPPPHSAPNRSTSPFYVDPFVVAPNAYPGPPGIIGPNAAQAPLPQTLPGYGYFGGGDYFFFNFAAFTPNLPPGDRQSYYASFTRDLCDKYLTVFADFKYTRSYFDASLAAVPFTPDAFKTPGTNAFFSPTGISVPIQNAFNPFTVGDTTLVINGIPTPMTTGVRFRGINDTGPRHEKFTYQDSLFDVGLRGQMGEFGDYFKTWNWETGFRYSRNEGTDISVGEVSQPGLRDALLDTDPATAFNAFGGFFSRNSREARGRVYVNLQNTGVVELPLYYATLNGDLFNLPAGPVSFALGGEFEAPTFTRTRDPLNTTFQSIGSVDGQGFRVNRDVWAMYQEIRIPVTSPTWNFPGAYSLEFDLAEREEWYSQNTSAVLPAGVFPFQPAVSTQYNTQRPKFSVRWQPLDPKYIGALTLRASYSEGFHAPTLSEITPASSQSFPLVSDPFSPNTETQIEERILGNPNTHPEVAYEWSYGAVYSPKWLKGLTLSADWWHIDMRDIVSALGSQFILESNPPTPGIQQQGPLVFRGLTTDPVGDPNGPALLVIDPSANLAGAVFEGLDYEAIYIFDMTNFGGPDIGRFTYTANGTWLSRARLQPLPSVKPFNINGQFLPPGFNLTGSLPWNRANFSLFYDGPANTWMAGFDVGTVVHYIGEYNDDNLTLTTAGLAGLPGVPVPKLTQPATGFKSNAARKVSAYTTFDLIASYTFNLPAPVAQQEVAGYSKDGGKNVRMKDGKDKNVMPVSTAAYNECGWRAWLNGVTVSAGLQNVLDAEPPFVAGSFENGYDESLTTIKGRFWYVGLKKRF